MERKPYEEFLDPSVEELNRTRKDRVAARKKQKKAQKRANRRKAMASGKKRRRKPNKVVLVLVIVIAIGLFASVRNITRLQSENKRLKEQNLKLSEKRDDLKKELKNVNSREYIEKRAREQLRLVNPGEIIFTFPDEDKE